MSDSEDSVIDEDDSGEESGSGSALARVLRRSIPMKRGRTEKPLLRKSAAGWSARGQRLVDRFDELLRIHDDLLPRVEEIEGEDGAEDIVHDFDALVAVINGLTSTRVDNEKDARETRTREVAEAIRDAQDIGRALDFHEAPTPGGLTAMLTADTQAVTGLLASGGKDQLERIVERLPDTEEGIGALEDIQDQVMASKGWISREAHEVFFRRKTDMSESVAFEKIDDSDNPKLDGLKGLPKEEYWRLFMDGRHQGGGDKHFFDRSFGYMGSMMKGLNKIVDDIDEPMSIDFIKGMHECATYQVTTETLAAMVAPNVFQEQGLKQAKNSWGCCYEFTDEGLDELEAQRDEMNLIVPGYFADQPPKPLTRGGIARDVPEFAAGESLIGRPPDEVQAAVTLLLEHTLSKFDEEMVDAEEVVDDDARSDAVIGAIIDCCRRLGQIHPFKDANGRLNMFLLLNKMLLEKGMSPTILNDQGDMIGKDRAELVRLIKAGQLRVEGLKV